jgi:hypothetical protein
MDTISADSEQAPSTIIVCLNFHNNFLIKD